MMLVPNLFSLRLLTKPKIQSNSFHTLKLCVTIIRSFFHFDLLATKIGYQNNDNNDDDNDNIGNYNDINKFDDDNGGDSEKFSADQQREEYDKLERQKLITSEFNKRRRNTDKLIQVSKNLINNFL